VIRKEVWFAVSYVSTTPVQIVWDSAGKTPEFLTLALKFGKLLFFNVLLPWTGHENYFHDIIFFSYVL
jgi:hypothetical protein